MKPYFIALGFTPILTFAHFMFPGAAFMFFIMGMIAIFTYFLFTYKIPEYEWPELSFEQNDMMITLVMSKKDGTTKKNYLSMRRLDLPVRERVVEKTQSSIWHVLGMMPSNNRADIEKAFRKMSMVYHPDTGGNAKAFNTLVNAKEKALQKCLD